MLREQNSNFESYTTGSLHVLAPHAPGLHYAHAVEYRVRDSLIAIVPGITAGYGLKMADGDL